MFNFIFNRGSGITTAELQEKLKSKIHLIDVRSPQEYAGGHIKEAKNVPLDTINSYNPKKKDEKIYIVCHSGARSQRAAQVLQSKGYDVVSVNGGMMSWPGPIKGGK